MGMPANIKRFRVNPVEIVIFLGVLGAFSNSIYRLFEDRESLKAAQRQFAEVVSQGADRAPASVPSSSSNTFATLEMNCQGATTIQTQAQKVRLGGKLCGADLQDAAGVTVQKSEITNTSNQYSATVFTDGKAARFTTDYIPLDPGTNTFKVEFSYNGHQYHQDLVIQQSPATPASAE